MRFKNATNTTLTRLFVVKGRKYSTEQSVFPRLENSTDTGHSNTIAPWSFNSTKQLTINTLCDETCPIAVKEIIVAYVASNVEHLAHIKRAPRTDVFIGTKSSPNLELDAYFSGNTSGRPKSEENRSEDG